MTARRTNSRTWKLRHPEEVRNMHREYDTRRRLAGVAIRRRLLTGRRCLTCGTTVNLCFHHPPEVAKAFEMGHAHRMYGISRLEAAMRAEAGLCVVLCTRHHGIEHGRLRRLERAARESGAQGSLDLGV